MSSENLSVRVVLDAVDRASGPFRRAREASAGLRQPLGQAAQRLKALEAQAKGMQKFQDLKTEAARNSVAFNETQRKAQQLGRQLQAAGAPADRLRSDLQAARSETQKLQAAEAKAGSALEKAQDRVKRLASQMAATEAPSAKLRQAFQAAQASTQDLAAAHQASTAALDASRRRTAALGQQMAATEAATAKLKNEFAAARSQVNALDQAKQRSTQEMQRLRQQLAGAGVDTRALAAEQRRIKAEIAAVTAAAEQQAAALARMATLRKAVNDNQARRQELGGQVVETTALAATLAAPVMAAVKFESVMADVRKVVDFDTPDGFANMSADILEMSTKIPMAADGIGAIVAAAGQAGIARGELTRFASDAAKMGVAFDQTGEQAGSAMTGLRAQFKLSQDQVVLLGDALNHLSNNMDARASGLLDITNRVAGQGRMFGLTGQQIAALGATFLSLKTPPEVASTAINALLGRLQTAPQQSKEFQEALNGIGISATGMRDAIKINAQGALLHFLQAVKKAEDPMATLTSMFGSEFSDDMAKLIGSMDTYGKALGLVADQSAYAGSMEKEYQQRADTTANNLQLLGNRVNRLGISLGSILLPPLNLVAAGLGHIADAAVGFAQTFPGLTTFAVSTAAALIVLKVATLAGGFAATYARGGWIQLRLAWEAASSGAALARASTLANTVATNANTAAARLNATASRARGWAAIERAASMGQATAATNANTAATAAGGRASLLTAAAWRGMGAGALRLLTSGLGLATAGVRVLGLAMLTSPVGLIATGIAAAAFMIYRYWQPIRAFFTGIWAGLQEGLAPLFAAFAPLAPIGQAIKDVFAGIAGVIADLFGGIGDQMQMTSEELSGITAAGAMVGKALAAAFTLVTMPLRMLIGGVQILRDVFSAVFSWSPMQTIQAAWSGVATFFDTLWGGILSKVTAVWDRIKGMIDIARSLLPGLLGGDQVITPVNQEQRPLVQPPVAVPVTQIQQVRAPALAAGGQTAATIRRPSAPGALEPIAGVQAPATVRPLQVNQPPAMASASVQRITPVPLPTMAASAPANNNLPRIVANDAAPLPRIVPVPAVAGRSAPAPAPAVSQTNSYDIQIHAAPGMSAQDIAREVRRQLEARDREQLSASRSQQYDRLR